MNQKRSYKTWITDPSESIPYATLYKRRRQQLTRQDRNATPLGPMIMNSGNINNGRFLDIDNHEFVNESLATINDDNEIFDWHISDEEPVSIGDQNVTTESESNIIEDTHDSTPLYEGSRISKTEAEFLLLAFAVRHHLTECGIQDLLDIINSLLPTPLAATNYLFFKKIQQFYSDLQGTKNFYCKECGSSLESVGNGECCATCDAPYCTDNFYYNIPLQPQLQHLCSKPDIYKLLCRADETDDIHTGEYYKNLKNNGIIKNGDISLTINTDGVSPFRSSNVSLWPIQIAINELPYSIRRANILLCGLWLSSKTGDSKPDMDQYLNVVVQEMISLSQVGFTVCHDGVEINIKAHLILCSMDSVARPLVQAVKQYNGEHGCTYCLVPGQCLNAADPAIKSNARVYPGSSIGVRRTVEQHLRDSEIFLKTGKIQNGVKGPSILSLCESFDVGQSFAFDYLHTVLLGVVKTLVDAWLDSSNKDKEWYLRPNSIDEIDNRLLGMQPPIEISRSPRSIRQKANWKGSEWRNFLLYYSEPCLHDILPKKFLKHWKKLALAITLYLQPTISMEDHNKAEHLLRSFVGDVQFLYGLEFCKFNFHMLLHIPENVILHGPLWTTSTFMFEHYNGILVKLFHNSQGIVQQIHKRYSRYKAVEHLSYKLQKNFTVDKSTNLSGKLFQKFCSELHLSPLAAANSCDSAKKVILSKPGKGVVKLNLTTVCEIEKVLQMKVKPGAMVHPWGNFGGMICHSNDNSKLVKRNNSTVKLSDGRYVIIKNIVTVSSDDELVDDDNVLLLECELLKIYPQNIFEGICVQRSGTICIIKPFLLQKKCILIRLQISNSELFLLKILTNHFEKD